MKKIIFIQIKYSRKKLLVKRFTVENIKHRYCTVSLLVKKLLPSDGLHPLHLQSYCNPLRFLSPPRFNVLNNRQLKNKKKVLFFFFFFFNNLFVFSVMISVWQYLSNTRRARKLV